VEHNEEQIYHAMSTKDSKLLAKSPSNHVNNFKKFKKVTSFTLFQSFKSPVGQSKVKICMASADTDPNPGMEAFAEDFNEEERKKQQEDEKAESLFNTSFSKDRKRRK
jgi:hypothetical protein